MAARKKTKEDQPKEKPKAGVSRAAKEVAFVASKDGATADPEKRRALAALVNKLGDQLIPASRLGNVYMLRRPTGVIEVDIALGGGFPSGGASMLSGPYNSGKTWALFKTLAMQQRLYGNSCAVALHVAETQVPYDQMRQAGIQVEVPDSVIRQYIERDVLLGLPEWTAEKIAEWKKQVGTIHIIGGGTGETVLQCVLDCVRANVFSVVGLDSITALQPTRDASKEMDEESARAAKAIMMGKFWDKYTPLVNRGDNTTTLLCTQQVRQSDAKFGLEWVVTGGEATKHAKLIDLLMYPGAQVKKTIQGRDYTVGKKTSFRTLKGKAGTHDNIRGEFTFYYSEFFPGNVDVHGDLITYAMQQGLLLRTSKGVQLISGATREAIPGAAATTDAALREMLANDFDLELLFRRHILAAAGLHCLYR